MARDSVVFTLRARVVGTSLLFALENRSAPRAGVARLS